MELQFGMFYIEKLSYYSLPGPLPDLSHALPLWTRDAVIGHGRDCVKDVIRLYTCMGVKISYPLPAKTLLPLPTVVIDDVWYYNNDALTKYAEAFVGAVVNEIEFQRNVKKEVHEPPAGVPKSSRIRARLLSAWRWLSEFR